MLQTPLDRTMVLDRATVALIRAPELTFYELSHGQVDKECCLPSDIWSMACTVSLLLTTGVMTLIYVLDIRAEFRIRQLRTICAPACG